jgi:hypothetical protein
MQMPYGERPYVPARDPLAAIPPSRHPFQFWSLVACVAGGAGNLYGSSGLLSALLPRYAVVTWALVMMVGGMIAIVGSWWRDRVTGLLMERIALTAIASTSLVYGGSVIYLFGERVVLAGAITVGVSIASAWRVVHVNRELKVLRQFIDRTF